MKTEINLENKAKFFAQYLGQDILHGRYGVNGNLVDLIANKDTGDKYWLELKPLSLITDEDAIEVVKILQGIGITSTAMREPKEYCLNAIGKTLYLTSPVVDYLRSKGYALPWMDLSVDEMIDAGWIRISE